MHQSFERIYPTKDSREKYQQIEKDTSIELSDSEHSERLQRTGHYVKFNKGPKFDDTPLKVSKDMEEAGFFYKPVKEESMSLNLKNKFKKARELIKESKSVDLR